MRLKTRSMVPWKFPLKFDSDRINGQRRQARGEMDEWTDGRDLNEFSCVHAADILIFCKEFFSFLGEFAANTIHFQLNEKLQ